MFAPNKNSISKYLISRYEMASGGLKSLTFSLNSVLVIPEYISKTLANAINIPSPIEDEELGELAN